MEKMIQKAFSDKTFSSNVGANEVNIGDTLPGLSQKIYNSCDYYVQLAEFNGLDKFRQLQPGMRLIFPPVITPMVNQ